MTDTFNPAEELTRHGLFDASVGPEATAVINTLTRAQVEACIEVKRRVDLLEEPSVQALPVEDGSRPLAMAAAMGWDRPSIALVDAEVEGMSVSPAESACLCACTGGGGGGGA